MTLYSTVNTAVNTALYINLYINLYTTLYTILPTTLCVPGGWGTCLRRLTRMVMVRWTWRRCCVSCSSWTLASQRRFWSKSSRWVMWWSCDGHVRIMWWLCDDHMMSCDVMCCHVMSCDGHVMVTWLPINFPCDQFTLDLPITHTHTHTHTHRKQTQMAIMMAR